MPRSIPSTYVRSICPWQHNHMCTCIYVRTYLSATIYVHSTIILVDPPPQKHQGQPPLVEWEAFLESWSCYNQEGYSCPTAARGKRRGVHIRMYLYMYSTCTPLQHTRAHTVAMHTTCNNGLTSMCCTSCYAILTGQIFSFGVPSTRMTIHNWSMSFSPCQ